MWILKPKVALSKDYSVRASKMFGTYKPRYLPCNGHSKHYIVKEIYQICELVRNYYYLNLSRK
jgi:hypothetical protein